MFAVLRQRNFALLWFGQLISTIGDWVLNIALPFYVFSLTGSVVATVTISVTMTLPRLLFGSLAGVFVDRWDRRKTMIAADLLRAAVLLLLLAARSREWVWLIGVTAFVQSTISQFFVPSKSAIIPRLVGERDLVAANSLNAMSDSLTRLVGPALGGALMGWLGLSSVVAVDSVSYLVSAAMIALVVLPAAPAGRRVEPTHPAAQWTAVWQEWLSGLRLLSQERPLAAVFVVLGVALFADSTLSVLIVPFVKDVMQSDAQHLGWMLTAQGTGGLIGGLLVGQVGKSVPQHRLIAWGLLATALLLLALVNWPIFVLALPLMVAVGIVVMSWLISTQTLLQLSVSDTYRGRVFGTLGTTTALTSLCGMGLAALLGDCLGANSVMNLAGGLYLLSGVVALVVLHEPQPAQAAGIAATFRRTANE